MREPNEILAELIQSIRAQERAKMISQLDGVAAPQKAPRVTPVTAKIKTKAKPTAKEERRKGEQRPKEEINRMVEQIVEFVRQHPGCSTAEMRETLKLSALDMQFPLRKLREDKVFLMKGSRGQARYTLKSLTGAKS